MEPNNELLERLTEDQKSEVYHLMAISNIEDVNAAVKLYIESNYDINRAVQRWLDRQSGIDHQPPVTHDPFTANAQPGMNNPPQQPRNNESELHTQYRNYIQSKTRAEEEKGYSESIQKGVVNVMSGLKSFWNSKVPIAIRGETPGGEQFFEFFKKNYPPFSKDLKFNLGTFEENMNQAHNEKRPLLVYIHNNGAAFKVIPFNLFKEKNMITFINTKFHLLGLLVNTDEIQKVVKYMEPKHFPCFAMFRMNLLDETVLLEFIALTNESTSEQVLEQLQNIEKSYQAVNIEENKIKQDVKRSIENQERRNMQLNSPFAFQGQNEEQIAAQLFQFFGGVQQQQQPRPVDPVEQQRLEEARILRQIQEEEFKEVERRIMEQQNKQAEDDRTKKEKEEQDAIIKKQKEEEEKQKSEQKELVKKQKLERLPAEPTEDAQDVVLVIFRLPDGSRLERKFRNSDKIEALYDFVDIQDVLFDKSTARYDLIQPMPFLCLDDREKTLNDHFEGSDHEVIHIREHTD